MRFAGQAFNKFPDQKDFSDADNYMKHTRRRAFNSKIQNPVVPGFNSEDLAPTPELLNLFRRMVETKLYK